METQIQLHIEARESFADGMVFADSGPYERLWGRVEFALDPSSARYDQVVDIEHAPRRADGTVEFSTDIYILKPVELARGNGRLIYEVNNRGTKLLLQFLNDGLQHEQPASEAHGGNGFLMRRGYTVVWSGWQGDVLGLEGRLSMQLPVATRDGKAITGVVRTEFAPGYEGTGYALNQNFGNREGIFSIPLSGNAYTASYETTSLDTSKASLTVREYETDPRLPIPPQEWKFARLDDAGSVVESKTDCLLPDGFKRGWIYELMYSATNPVVMGLGFTGVRDLIDWLRHDKLDVAGNPNPLRESEVGIEKAYAWGCSQSARFLREFVYRGYNEDRAGNAVFEGVCPFVSGAGRVALNYRFAQPGRYPRQHFDHLFPSDQFPFAYPVIFDPLTGKNDGILQRPSSDPFVLHTQSASEYWQRRGSLVHTDVMGEDLEDHEKARVYLFASAEHAPDPLQVPRDELARYPTNPLNVGALLRAMQDNLDDWVSRGVVPPDSRVPRREDATAVSGEQVRASFPVVPEVDTLPSPNRLFVQDHGEDFEAGLFSLEPPTEDQEREYAVLVPSVDQDGNDIPGIRGPGLAVPFATYTGWNFRRLGEAEHSMAAVYGSYLAFPATESERAENKDSRVSLETRYPNLDEYVARVTEAARGLVEQRLLLEEDAERFIALARSVGPRPAI